jgi:two-component system, NarL family, nitrate/nitrite response regulator NarL
MREVVSTVLIDTCTLFREGLARVLSRSRFRVVGKFSTVTDIAHHLHGQTRLFVVGVHAAHGDMTELRSIKQDYPEARVMVLADYLETQSLRGALRCGADGYLEKTICCEALVKSLELVMLGNFVVPEAALPALTELAVAPEDRCEAVEPTPAPSGEQTPSIPLTAREVEVVKCLTEGVSNKQIALRFDITEATVKVHVKAILRKLRAKNRTQAAIWASAHLSESGVDLVPICLASGPCLSPRGPVIPGKARECAQASVSQGAGDCPESTDKHIAVASRFHSGIRSRGV